MTTEKLQKFHLAQPFVPFTLQMADGREYYVPHSEFLSYSPAGRTAVVHFEGDEGDDFDVLELLLMTGIKVHKNGAASKLGGSGRKK